MTQYNVDRRKFLKDAGLTLGGLGLLTLVGCRPTSGQTPAANGGGGSNPYTGDMAITHLNAIINSAPFHVAAAQGFFEDEELDLEAVSFSGGSDTVRGITQAGMGFGMVSAIAVLVAQQEAAADLRVIGGLYNAPTIVFIAPTDSDINNIDDLRGRKLAVSQPGSITSYFAAKVPQSVGLVAGTDYEIVNVGGPSETWTAAQQGVVDLAWGTPPLTAKMVADGDAKIVIDTNDYVDDWADTSLVTTQQFIDQNGDVLSRWMQGLHRSLEMIRNDPDGAGEIVARAYEMDDVAVVAQVLRDTVGNWGLDINRAGVEANADAAKELGQLKSDPDLDVIIVEDFVPQAERA